MRRGDYQPLFPWFGGKSPVADEIWRRFGDVKNYVEPFAGSLAVLFLRPDGPGSIETVNDADGLLSNFWRALQHAPDSVAEHADWPVNEADLHARHLWLLGQRERITERLMGDAEFYDAKAAGWWVWGQCCWIGSGWCSGKGPWISENGVLTLRNGGRGVNRKRPHLSDSGRGVNRKRPHLSDSGKGGYSETPASGITRQIPHLSANNPNGQGINAMRRKGWLKGYLGEFAQRLSRVRVCCGDWSRVCGPSVTFRHGLTGVFLDPPYADSADRTSGLYATDCEQVAHKAREWAIEQGENPLMRICLAGYSGEHEMPKSWSVFEWEAAGGYGLISDDDEATGRANKWRERLWFSPHCISPKPVRDLFSGAVA
ncbi:MAG: DNA adenine methylase [Elusimicrobia bacterium]|nr:DNA adenine methylase [Elusimicrobiota bacterium]